MAPALCIIEFINTVAAISLVWRPENASMCFVERYYNTKVCEAGIWDQF